ncbi:mitochondrial enolase superfamily member 1 isoform X2 [Erpetoichthys calabaricus]|uniref:mitochondrial enolase superfamily member 1 isoform X2 n=1 Tax=Erpetoichthys calabaricus TaxID=27687 RepID=UPI00223451E8|nr:mitochondrial enolase superfamily member 1 isoform X2 [Erpetoichthys calabaricus]
MLDVKITKLTVSDVRFPTSFEHHGSDAMHSDPDYSAAYVVLETDAENGFKGYGLTFTLGRGTEIVVCAVKALTPLVLGKRFGDIVNDFRGFYRLLTSDGQMRWIGPEKGVIHLATSAVLNAVWDLWAKMECKVNSSFFFVFQPEQLVSCIDFRYITDVLTEKEAVDILRKAQSGKEQREEQMLKNGYPAYTTSCAWLGYSDDHLRKLCVKALEEGWTRFKVKVGADLQDDIRRCKLIREIIGPNNTLMIDANQRWNVDEAIKWVLSLAEFKPLWIEEPTSPDDILGHATISKALAHLGIGVATGEQCHNKVMFKQLLQAKAVQFVQIDSCRLGSVNENISVLLMANKFKVPVCPHAGGVGLCELVQHLILFDYITVSGSLENRMCEYVDHLHEHFKSPVIIKDAHYIPPQDAGYSTEMKEDSVKKYQFPDGEIWQELSSQMKCLT